MTDIDRNAATPGGGRFAWPAFGSAVRLPPAMRRPGAAQAVQAEFESGYDAGHAAGLAAAANEVRALKERLAASIGAMEQTRIKVDAQQQQRLVDLAHAICSKVLDLELTTTLNVFEAFVRTGLEHLDASAAAVRVHVNPADAAWLNAQIDGIIVEADETVAEGGVSIRTDERSVDFDPYALLDERFAEFRNG
jgi:flagellar biosynthesis/type III secretory pathway protein FliH